MASIEVKGGGVEIINVLVTLTVVTVTRSRVHYSRQPPRSTHFWGG